MSWRGEPVCEWSDLPKDMCAHCTGHLGSLDPEPEVDVDDPDMWEDDEDDVGSD